MKPISPQQAALELGVSDQTVRRLLHGGQLKGRKAGRDWLIPRAAFDAFAQGFVARAKGRPAAPQRPVQADDGTTPRRGPGRPRKVTQEKNDAND